MPALPEIGRRLSVVIPTYRRPGYIRSCLSSLECQRRKTDELIVVYRKEDQETANVARDFGEGVHAVITDEPGVVAALSAGLSAATGDVLVFTDDDATAPSGWLDRIRGAFEDPTVGGFGGRDLIPAFDGQSADRVGIVTAWGKLIGNHHLGIGDPHDVDVLKGVNMALRRSAVGVPVGLRGSTTQAHWEVAMSLWARKNGWRLVYDPRLVVNHAWARRATADSRTRPEWDVVRTDTYNLVMSMLSFRMDLFWRRAAYGVLVGSRAEPGLVRAMVGLLGREWEIIRRLLPSLFGQCQALVDLAQGHRIRMVALRGPASTTALEQFQVQGAQPHTEDVI